MTRRPVRSQNYAFQNGDLTMPMQGPSGSPLPSPPANFPVPDVPGYGSNLPNPGYLIDRSMYTRQGHTQQTVHHPAPPQFPIAPIHPTGGHLSAVPRALGPITPQLQAGHHARPPTALPQPDFLPPYLYGGIATPGRPDIPERVHPPNPLYHASYELVPSHTSDWLHPQVRNPPSWSLSTSARPQPLYDVSREYQAHPPHALFAQPYSPRVGQKKALAVGIDYSGHPDRRFRLKWAVHDAHKIARFLHERLGFHNTRILTDDQPENLPTKANILAAMHWLVDGAQPGDNLFFYFSGHAMQVKDTNGDESDGKDECMCAMDYMGDGQFPSAATPGIIVDDEIHRIMVKPLPQGCRLTAVLDCCHSGTLMDIPFIYDPHGNLKPYNPNVAQQKSSLADVISLSACKDSERAYEAREGGALRKAFIEYMLSFVNRGTYLDIIKSLRAYMNTNRFGQRPQLSSSHEIDINQPFIISG